MALLRTLLIGGILVAGGGQSAAQLFITLQPESRTVSVGVNVSFSVSVADGVEPLSYQWRRDEIDLAGETNATLTLTNVQPAQSGRYTVVVTDGFEDSVTSEAAILRVDLAFTKVTTGDIVMDAGPSRGAAWGDFDNDGWLDLFVANDNGQNNFLYKNDGHGGFVRIEAGSIVSDGGRSQCAAWADYDNDGWLDLYVANGDVDRELNFLYHNNGDGTFSRVTEGIIATDNRYSLGCAWGDYDRDGWLDLFVCDGYRAVGEVNSLYHNKGDGTFTKIAEGAIVADDGNAVGCIWADYDNDGDLDLFVANATVGENLLYRNDGDGTFTKISEGSVVTDSSVAQFAAWADYDNDGFPDLFVANHNQGSFLYHNEGNGAFARVLEGAIVNDGGNSHCGNWADYDNDGFQDLFVTDGHGALLFHNNGDGAFTRVTDLAPVLDVGDPQAAAWGDYDNDGFLDLFVSNFNRNSLLYHNDGNSNGWIKIKLTGSVSNRSAIGAKVRVKAVIRGSVRWQLREIASPTGYGGNSLCAHFGVADATNIDTVRIELPSGGVQELHDLAPRQCLSVTEPPRLQAMGRLPDGSFQMQLTAWPGMRFTLETSTDLTSWIPWTTVTTSGRSTLVTDATAADTAQRFYRAVVP